MFGLSGSKNDR